MSSSFKIRYSASDGIIRVLFLGATSLDTHRRAGQQIVARFRHLKRLRILADMRYAEFALSPAEQAELTDFVLGEPMLRQADIAMVISADFDLTALTIESMARYGVASRLFAVESEAVGWLKA